MKKLLVAVSLVLIASCGGLTPTTIDPNNGTDSGNGATDWATYQTKFDGTACANDVNSTMDYDFTLSTIAGTDSTVARDGTNATLLECILTNATATDGCMDKVGLCATSSDCTFTDLLTAACDTESDSEIVGCTIPEECSSLDLSEWDKSQFLNTPFDTCATLTAADNALEIDTINDGQCAGGSGEINKAYAGDATDLTLTLTVNSWSNMNGNGSGIGLALENQSVTNTSALYIARGPSGNWRCNYTNLQESNDCNLGADNTTPITLKLILSGGSVEAQYKVGNGDFQSLGSQDFDTSSGLRFAINISNQLDGMSAVVSDFTLTTP